VAQRIQTIHTRQPDVKEDEIGAIPGGQGDGVLSRGRGAHSVARLLQVEAHAPAQEGVVIYE
jgi:hypothetical protein